MKIFNIFIKNFHIARPQLDLKVPVFLRENFEISSKGLWNYKAATEPAWKEMCLKWQNVKDFKGFSLCHINSIKLRISFIHSKWKKKVVREIVT